MMAPEVWSAIADWVVAVSAALAAWTAYRGLNSWREQQIWQTDNEIAQKLINNLYDYRDALYGFRSVYISLEEENQLGSADVPDPEYFDVFMEKMRPILLDRFERLAKSVRAFQASRRDAFFHWGAEVPLEFDSVLELYLQIRRLIEGYYVELSKKGAEEREILYLQLKEAGSVLTAKAEDSHGHVGKLRHDIISIENYLKKKIGRRP